MLSLNMTATSRGRSSGIFIDVTPSHERQLICRHDIGLHWRSVTPSEVDNSTSADYTNPRGCFQCKRAPCASILILSTDCRHPRTVVTRRPAHTCRRCTNGRTVFHNSSVLRGASNDNDDGHMTYVTIAICARQFVPQTKYRQPEQRPRAERAGETPAN